ncbi:hypothetical protein ACELLULO517_15015 [Acidisoma cellulosilytica]|uniref:Uncharacterized protein n=1 Tax=Acidisoma cellulosilyticum TaxID=2802395 RepID=A0A963Z2I2_9PROT|nr:hypothetical protein [Acidisoma cellulosilyticum]MCB8881560.1 hypothetical protein [Acidisoma cellulosilyticum]
MYALLLATAGFVCLESGKCAGISEAQFDVTAQVNGSCTVNMNWLLSVTDHVTASLCEDGTPVQIYVNLAYKQENHKARTAMRGTGAGIPAGGVESCGAETSSNPSDDNAQSGAGVPFDTSAWAQGRPSRLAVVSACF